MAERIKLKEWLNKNPDGTLKDFEAAAGRAANSVEKSMFGAKKNIEKASSAGIKNDKGSFSLADNPVAQIASSAYDKITRNPEATKEAIVKVNDEIKDTLQRMDGKSQEEQKKEAEKVFSLPKAESPVKKAVEKMPEETEEKPVIEEPKEEKETEAKAKTKRESFLESWAATHPTWGQILKSDKLSFGQKAALIGGALANIGANTAFGIKSGFEHSGFSPVEWDFKKAVDKYSNQEIENVLGSEQSAKARDKYASYFSDMVDKYGPEKMDEMFQLVDTYGDNPAILKSRLEALGIKEDSEEIKKAYATREKVSAQEQAKRERLDTEIKALQKKITEIQASVTDMDADLKKETLAGLKEAQKAINNYNRVKYSSDATTYNIEKAAGYVKAAAETVGGIVSGGVVGGTSSIKMKDGLIKGKGIPQKIVRADGSEIELDPNDNIYATKNAITTDSDNGEDIIPMGLDDFITYQNRLGYEGGAINKDFEYYLKKLEAC